MKLARKLLAVLLAVALCPLMCAGAEEAPPEVSEAAPAETPPDIPVEEALPEAAPEAEAPPADVPETDMPETETPDTDITETEAPNIDIPETQAPDADIPQTDIPDADIPETQAPDVDIPDTPATEAPTAGPTAAPDPFASAKIKVERVGGGELRIGDELTLEVRVTGVGVKFELIWLACPVGAKPVDGRLPWAALKPEVKGERCAIALTEESVKLRYAARIVGTEIIGTYDLPPVLPAATQEPETPEAVHPLPELDKPLFSITEDGAVPAPDDEAEPDDAPVDKPDAPAETPEAVHPLPELDEPFFIITDDGVVPARGDTPVEKPGAAEPEAPAEDEEVPKFEYERDSDGELVLDERGNPKPFVPEGVAPPAGWARDEEGALLLDDEGDPIPLFADYERDENGELVLDERGDPIPVVPEGADIPVAYERDEDGELVLDADGNPIPVQFIPPTSQSVRTLEDLLDPDRSIEIFADWGGGALHFGDELTLTAVLHGYDNAVYTLQWQRSADDASWEDIPGETRPTYVFPVTETNAADFWRVTVTITDATPPEVEA